MYFRKYTYSEMTYPIKFSNNVGKHEKLDLFIHTTEQDNYNKNVSV